MRTIISILALLLTCEQVLGQIDAKVLTAYSGLKNTRLLGDLVVGESEKDITVSQIGLITVTTKASIVEFYASDSSRKDSSWFSLPEVIEGEQRTITYVVTTPGDNWIEALCIDFDKKIYNKYKTTVTIGPPTPPVPPTPPTPPKPDVPPDAFNNIGQRVAEWTKGNPNNKIIGQFYLDASKKIRSDPSVTVNDVANALVIKLKESPAYINYEAFKNGVNTDIASRSNMTKAVLADYWKCIALGLGVEEK